MCIKALIFHYRYVSHCALIEFKLPRIECQVNHFKTLKTVMEESSSSVGYIISLGESFIRDSHDDMDKLILPKIKEIFGEEVPPRI